MVAKLDIEVVYATAERQHLITLSVPQGTTLCDAVRLSGLACYIEGANIETMPIGVFGERVKQPEKRLVAAGERVEIYRPLRCDPKKQRQERAIKP